MTRTGTREGSRHRGWFLVAVGLTTMLFAALATSASAERTGVSAAKGSPTTCAEVGYPEALKFPILTVGYHDGAQASYGNAFAAYFDFSEDGTAFDFSTTDGTTHAIVVKGKNTKNYNVYAYSGVLNEADSGVAPAPNGQEVVKPIKYAFVCYTWDPPVVTTTTTTAAPTTTTIRHATTTTTTEATTTTEPEVVTTLANPTTTTAAATTTAAPTTTVAPTTQPATTAAAGTTALPYTGSGSGLLAAIGFTLLLSGAAMLAADRRRAVRPLR